MSAVVTNKAPTGGMGMGMDRLMIMLTGESIRETILFPFVRPS